MRIAHIGNTAGLGSKLAKEQKKDGHDTTVFTFDDQTQKRFGGIRINYNSIIDKFRFFKSLKLYDVWHYHYPFGSLKDNLERKSKEKTFLKHYHGSDLRLTKSIDYDFCLISTPDLSKFAPNAKWLPIPVDLDDLNKFSSFSKRINEDIIVSHYPYYINKPEWDFFTPTFSFLEQKNKIKLCRIINMNHDKSMEMIAKSDIFIGKVIPEMGWFGTVETEAMALGKPVIAYIADELYDLYKPPVFRTTRESFKEDILHLMENESERKRLSREGPIYVKKYHDLHSVSDDVYNHYEYCKNIV